MTIHIPRPWAIALGGLFGLPILWLILQELPDLVRYAKFEGV